MSIEETGMRGAVWFAIAAYAGASSALLFRAARPARTLWALGCTAFCVHAVMAFAMFYDWSHVKGLKETARQTRDLTGLNTGVGLYWNYAFGLIWLADTVFWFRVGSERYRSRRRLWTCALHAFFVFMIVNGGIVFASGPVRWFTAVCLSSLLGAWWATRRGRS